MGSIPRIKSISHISAVSSFKSAMEVRRPISSHPPPHFPRHILLRTYHFMPSWVGYKALARFNFRHGTGGTLLPRIFPSLLSSPVTSRRLPQHFPGYCRGFPQFCRNITYTTTYISDLSVLHHYCIATVCIVFPHRGKVCFLSNCLLLL